MSVWVPHESLSVVSPRITLGLYDLLIHIGKLVVDLALNSTYRYQREVAEMAKGYAE